MSNGGSSSSKKRVAQETMASAASQEDEEISSIQTCTTTSKATQKKLERKRRHGFEIIDQDHPVAQRLQAIIEQAKKARSRAVEAHKDLGAVYDDNTVASDGTKTINGWAEDTPQGFSRADPEEIREYGNNTLGHNMSKSGGLDFGGRKEEGFPGKRRASDAEKQLVYLKPNEPIGVSREMCKDCTAFFQKEAQLRGTAQVVSEPGGTNIFDPETGQMFFLPD